MSNKKSTVALYKKRKSLKNIFFKYWLIILVISALIFALGLTIFAESARNHIKNLFYQAKNQTSDYVNSQISEYDITTRGNFLSFRFCSRLHSLGIPSLLYDNSTGDIIAGCEEQMFLLRRMGESDVAIYAYPTSNIPNWTSHYERLETYNNLLNYTGEDIDMPYFYTDGTNFIPDKFSAHCHTYGRFDYDLNENPVFTTNFDTPSEIPKGYEKYAYSQGEYFPVIVWGYHKNSPNFHPPYNIDFTAAYNFLMKTHERLISSANNPMPEKIEENIFTLSMYCQTEFTDASNRSFILLNAIDYNVLDVYKTIIIVVGIVLIAFSLGLAFLLSRVSYARLKAGYDMEDYRKTLINTMAHDLKSPLMAISGYAENLLNNVHSEKREYYANAILNNVQHTNQIIESVLTLSKTENNIQLSRENAEIANLVNDCLKQYELLIGEKNLSFEISGNALLSVDQALFTQALDNLVGNAVKYATPTTTINITLQADFISIKNHCANAPAVDVSTLCQPFVTGNTSRSNKSGSGLGLAIVKNICDLHDFTLKLNFTNNHFVATIHST